MTKIKISGFDVEYKIDGDKLTYLKFLNTDQLVAIDIKILNKFEKMCLSLKTQELYEHGIIRLENSLRNFDKVKYEGIFFAENYSETFKKLKEFLRNFVNQVFKLDFKTKNNFQSIEKNKSWINFSKNEKNEILKKNITSFKKSKFKNIDVELVDFINDEEIYLNFLNEVSVHEKEEFLFSLEVFLKENVSNHLLIYMSAMIDKNKGRRLTL